MPKTTLHMLMSHLDNDLRGYVLGKMSCPQILKLRKEKLINNLCWNEIQKWVKCLNLSDIEHLSPETVSDKIFNVTKLDEFFDNFPQVSFIVVEESYMNIIDIIRQVLTGYPRLKGIELKYNSKDKVSITELFEVLSKFKCIRKLSIIDSENEYNPRTFDCDNLNKLENLEGSKIFYI